MRKLSEAKNNKHEKGKQATQVPFRLPNNLNRGGKSAESDDEKRREKEILGTVGEWMDVLFLVRQFPPLLSSCSSPRPGALLRNAPGVCYTGRLLCRVNWTIGPFCTPYIHGGLVPCCLFRCLISFSFFPRVNHSRSRDRWQLKSVPLSSDWSIGAVSELEDRHAICFLLISPSSSVMLPCFSSWRVYTKIRVKQNTRSLPYDH